MCSRSRRRAAGTSMPFEFGSANAAWLYPRITLSGARNSWLTFASRRVLTRLEPDQFNGRVVRNALAAQIEHTYDLAAEMDGQNRSCTDLMRIRVGRVE